MAKNKTKPLMKVTSVATSNLTQKTSCVIPQISLDYLFRIILATYVNINLSGLAEGL